MKKLIAMLIALAVMLSAVTVLVSADDEEIYNRELTIYEIDTAPKIDGKIEDGEYHLVSSWPLDKEDFISRGDYVQNIKVEYYMCYDENNLYFAVKAQCDGEHVARMADKPKYIFNAHHLMTLIIPDDPTRTKEDGSSVYPGQEATWSQLNDGNYAYEFTTIFASEQTNKHDADVPFATNHFMDMVSKMQYSTAHTDGYDIYEIAMPWSAMTNSQNTTALTPEEGTVFGFDSTLGLTDISGINEVINNDGYDGADGVYYGNYLYFADGYGHGAKDLKHACVVTLGGEAPSDPIGDESEPAGDESEPEQGGESEPAGDESEDEGQGGEQGGQQGGNDPAPQTGDAGIIALAVVSVIALGGAVIVKKSK